MIKLIYGNIFDSKCDLLILPCNEYGGTTEIISSGLRENNLPRLKHNLELGEVEFHQVRTDFYQTFLIGYAASVAVDKRNLSHEDKISRIEKLHSSILNYAIKNKIRKINMPLLGSGAGKLSPEKAYKIIHKCFEQDDNIELCLHIISQDYYQRIINIFEQEKQRIIIANPRVFISYASTDKQNAKWTLKLANKLRENGVDARIDKYDLRKGNLLPQWMTNEILMAEKVLLICDKHYAEKANFNNGGVGWETMIIQGDILKNINTNKYIGIAREKNIEKSLPYFFESKCSFHWFDEYIDEKEYEELLFCIFDCDIAPELGHIPESIISIKHSKRSKNNI